MPGWPPEAEEGDLHFVINPCSVSLICSLNLLIKVNLKSFRHQNLFNINCIKIRSTSHQFSMHLLRFILKHVIWAGSWFSCA